MVGEYALAMQALGFQELNGFFVLGVIDINEYKNGAELGKLERQMSAQALGRACDEHNFVAH
jgi:hypothetical protein